MIKFTDEIKKPILRYTVALCITFLMAFPSLNALMSKRPSSVLKAAEVSDLHTLGAEVSKAQHKGAYTIAWWDYGYPLWYYAKTNTIIDGARHDQDNLIISKILSSPSQRLAAQLSRVAVETHILQRGKEVAPVLLQNLSPTLFFTSMEGSDAILPNKTREIYLYLPHRMMNILKTVMSFNYLETERTKANKSVIFDNTRIAKQKGRFITLKNGSLLDQQHGEITYKGEKRKLKEFIITENTQSGKTRVRSKSYDSSGEIVVLYMKSFKRFVIMDVETAQSNYIQMYALGRYNPELFELVHSSAYSKIYRLKL